MGREKTKEIDTNAPLQRASNIFSYKLSLIRLSDVLLFITAKSIAYFLGINHNDTGKDIGVMLLEAGFLSSLIINYYYTICSTKGGY